MNACGFLRCRCSAEVHIKGRERKQERERVSNLLRTSIRTYENSVYHLSTVGTDREGSRFQAKRAKTGKADCLLNLL